MFDSWPSQLPHNWVHMCTFMYGMKKYTMSKRVFILGRFLKQLDLPTPDPQQQVETFRKKPRKFVIARD